MGAFSTFDLHFDARVTLLNGVVICTHFLLTATASSRLLNLLVHLDRPRVELNDNLWLFFLFFLARSRDGIVVFSIALVTLRLSDHLSV